MHKDQKVSAKQARTFDIGHCLEDLIIRWLKIAGFQLKTRNENGEQFGFSVADGKFAGRVDGIILSFPKEFASTAKVTGQNSALFASAAEVTSQGSCIPYKAGFANNRSAWKQECLGFEDRSNFCDSWFDFEQG